MFSLVPQSWSMAPIHILQTVLLLCCQPVLHCFLLDIARDLISFSHIRSAIFVLDDPEKLGSVKEDIFRKSKVQTKVILRNNLWQMKNLSRMGNCGVFIRFQNEKYVSEYLNSVLKLNGFDKSIFKTLHWFIFLDKERSLENIFRYDSNVYLISREDKDADMSQIVETYSVEEGVQINKKVGTWSSKDRLGKKVKYSKHVSQLT